MCVNVQRLAWAWHEIQNTLRSHSSPLFQSSPRHIVIIISWSSRAVWFRIKRHLKWVVVSACLPPLIHLRSPAKGNGFLQSTNGWANRIDVERLVLTAPLLKTEEPKMCVKSRVRIVKDKIRLCYAKVITDVDIVVLLLYVLYTSHIHVFICI